MKKSIPSTIQDYFDSLIESLPFAATSIVIFDPQNKLKLSVKYHDLNGKEWRVLHYSNNDLEFRRDYFGMPEDPNFSHIVWITPTSVDEKHIDVSFIPDILVKADKIIDLNLTAVLDTITPGEMWPDNIALYHDEISNNLNSFINAIKELRIYAPDSRPLNKNHLNTLILYCRNPEAQIQEILFEDIRPAESFRKYLQLVFSKNLKPNDLKVLRALLAECESKDEDLIPWFQEDPIELAGFIYCFDILKRYGVINPFIQLNGLGIFNFDTTQFSKKIDSVLPIIIIDDNLLSNIVTLAERTITEGQIERIVKILQLQGLENIASAIQTETFPLIIFGLASYFIGSALDRKSLNIESLRWALELPNHIIFDDKFPETNFTFAAREILMLFYELAFVENCLSADYEKHEEITPLLDWYKNTGSYRLQYSYSKALHATKIIENKEIKTLLNRYLEALGQRIEKYLEYYDLILSNIIKRDTKGFFKHPRLSTNVIKDTVLGPAKRPTDKSRLWILVFDGMRLDTWEEIVKKHLTSSFEVVDEKLYLCTLPSVTDFARISLLAGSVPDDWTDYNGKRTNDHKVLVSRLFGLKREYAKDKLRVIIASETDFAQKKLDTKSMMYNILIYNLSDDWVHNFRSDIKSLNDTIERTVKEEILPDIERRIGNNDIMVLTSDHGFIELKKDNKIEVSTEIKGNLINYRYVIGSDIKPGIPVKWKEGNIYTVATGRNWFARPGGKFSRYSHGGISLDEMVVPGVVMMKMTKPLIEFDLLLPQELEFLEDSPSKIELEIHNKGNRKADYHLLVELDTGLTKSFKRKLEPAKKRQESFEFTPELSMKIIRFELTYTDIDKIERKLTKGVRIVVMPKKGKIEIDTSALDRLDL